MKTPNLLRLLKKCYDEVLYQMYAYKGRLQKCNGFRYYVFKKIRSNGFVVLSVCNFVSFFPPCCFVSLLIIGWISSPWTSSVITL